ncbi:uncharacterized protein YraI [Rhodanobacter sp. TND4EL1]
MKPLIRIALASLTLASASLAFPAQAHAAEGYVTGNVNLRAGPDVSYPLIDQIPAGSEVDVQGCTEGWEWCDVIAFGNRGWVAGNYVEYVYQDQPVLLPSYGARIGIPIVTFVIGNYWDNYYRNRPFYRERDQWYRRPIVRRPPPPPIRHPYRPPAYGAPGHGRPTVNRPRPPASTRPMQPRPWQSEQHQGNRPAPHGASRPMHPPMSQHTDQVTARPAPSNRSTPFVRPAPQNRPPANQPARNAGHATPARSDHGKSKSSDHRKDDHQGH